YLIRRNTRLRYAEDAIADQIPADDRFEFKNVPPGSYDLHIGFIGDGLGTNVAFAGRTTVDVVDRDITDLTVEIKAGIDIWGQFRLDETAAALKPDLTRITPEITILDGVPQFFGPGSSLDYYGTQQNGTFKLAHAARGRYR